MIPQAPRQDIQEARSVSPADGMTRRGELGQALARDSSDGPLAGRMYIEEQFGVSELALPVGGPLAR
jgi:hypothetical protein